MTQGERVRAIRSSLDFSLEKFGKQLGVGRSAISKIEKGENSLTDQMARLICREYNVNYDYLMAGDGEMFDNLPETVLDELCLQYDLDDYDRFLVELYISLPPELRAAAKNKARELLAKRREKESQTES